jgi:hypothetical protein
VRANSLSVWVYSASDRPVNFPVNAERSSLPTASSASQYWRFSLSVPFGPKFRFCGPKGPNIVRIRALDFSERQKTASIGPFFFEAVSSSAFSRSEGSREFSRCRSFGVLGQKFGEVCFMESNAAAKKATLTRYESAFSLWLLAHQTLEDAAITDRDVRSSFARALDHLFIQGHCEGAATITRRIFEISLQVGYLDSEEPERENRGRGYLAYLMNRIASKGRSHFRRWFRRCGWHI